MTDSDLTNSLFQPPMKIDKFLTKKYVKIYPTNPIYNEGVSIKYNCKNITDQMVLYHEGYFIINFQVETNGLGRARDFTLNNSNFIIDSASFTINNKEVDNQKYQWLTTEILNHVEYSTDYMGIEQQYSYVSSDEIEPVEDEDIVEGATNTKTHYEASQADVFRSLTYEQSATENNTTHFKISVPIKYLSPFFRALDFPVQHNEFEFEVVFNLRRLVKNLKIHEHIPGVKYQMLSTVLIFPTIELDAKDTKDYMKNIIEKPLIWYSHRNIYNEFTTHGYFSKEIVSSDVGVKQIVFVEIPDKYWKTSIGNGGSQYNPSATNLKIKDTNIEIDSKLFYQHDIHSNIEHYQLTRDCFNMQGTDVNTGALLSYSKWMHTQSYYLFDISRQKVLRSDPRKSQAIRFRTTIEHEGHVMIFVVNEKHTFINFKEPNKTRTI